MNENLVCTTGKLRDKATNAVQTKSNKEECFKTVRIRQRCLLSPTLFISFLERIMSDALKEHYEKVSICGNYQSLGLPTTQML